ncbi:MAG: hypothetical protein JO325_20390 [Solirubrobacterales bacterium]|nr:hypothetical protein [Solirubrobacterales bacterium]
MEQTTGTQPTSVVLTAANRDAILEEIEFAFECAGDLPFLLEHGAERACDRDDARDLIARLLAAVRLLDQLGWQRSGDRDDYVVEVDEAIDWFAARIERYALAGLEYNRQGLLTGDDRNRATTRRLVDSDLEKLEAARRVRTAFTIARSLASR